MEKGGIEIADLSTLERFSEFISASMGLHFPENRWRDLRRGLGTAAEEFGFRDAGSCMQWLISSPLTKGQVEILASHLTVGETYFLRDGRLFEVLEATTIPDLLRKKEAQRRLRIWSAGCATGEEPYSIAILLYKMIPDLQDWDITILATDINPGFLRKASAGVFNDWSFRSAPFWYKERYFRKTSDGRFEILREIGKMVTFSYLNLAEDVYPSLMNNTNALDLVLCRNVLMYFSQAMQREVISKLSKCLLQGGYLVVSPSEASNALFSQFRTVIHSNVTFYQKAEDLLTDIPPRAASPVFRGLEREIPMEETGGAFAAAASGSLEPAEGECGAVEPDQIRYREAFALYEDGHYGEAESRVSSLLSQDGEDPAAMGLLAHIYANQGRLSEGLELCEKALAIEKLNPGLHYLRANILQEQGRVEEAEVSLRRAVYSDNDFVLAHFAIGNICRSQGRHRASERYFENARVILSRLGRQDILPESEGMTAGRLMEIIETLTQKAGE